MGSGTKSMEIEGSFWVQKDDHKFLGEERITLLEKIDECGSITKAAKAVGISYKTAWDTISLMNNLAEKPLVERMIGGKGGGGSTLTPEGRELLLRFRIIDEHHRNFLKSLAANVGDTRQLYRFLRRIAMKVSARNVLAGEISGITRGAVNAEVTLVLKGGATITSTVTNGAIDNLGLKVGENAYAIIKATSIIIGTDLHDASVSARNIFCGTIAKLIEGPVSTEVDLDIGGSNTISAVITHDSSKNLCLEEGGHACALFKASSVILGVG